MSVTCNNRGTSLIVPHVELYVVVNKRSIESQSRYCARSEGLLINELRKTANPRAFVSEIRYVMRTRIAIQGTKSTLVCILRVGNSLTNLLSRLHRTSRNRCPDKSILADCRVSCRVIGRFRAVSLRSERNVTVRRQSVSDCYVWQRVGTNGFACGP